MIKPILGIAAVVSAAAGLTVAAPAQALANPTPMPSVTAVAPLLGGSTPALLGAAPILPNYIIDICRYMPGLPGCPRS